MFFSQDKQDEYLETHVFKGYKNGFFIGMKIVRGAYMEKERKRAAENNYTHIFAETAGQAPILLYTKEEDKFTELVLAKLGIQVPAKPAQK